MGFNESVTTVEAQEQRVNLLLACRWRPLGLFVDRRPAQEADVRWTDYITDPEFKKNLRIFYRLITGARSMCERAKIAPDEYGTLEARLGELEHLATLPGGEKAPPLTLKLLLGQRFQLERFLVEVGDLEYLRSRAADFYSEGEGMLITWKGLFPGQVPPLLDDRQRTLDPVEPTRRMLEQFIAAREEADLPLRARRELKERALWIVLPVMVLTTALFGFAVGHVDASRGNAYLLAAAAGAAGAAVGGLIGLRDKVSRGSQVREFLPFFLGQIVVGAAAGLLAYLVVEAKLVQVGTGEEGIAALAFVVGFSEAAFLRLIDLVGKGAGGKDEG